MNNTMFPWLEEAIESIDDTPIDLIQKIIRHLDTRILESDSSLIIDLKSLPLEKLSTPVLICICRFTYWKFKGTGEYHELIEMVRKTLDSKGKDSKNLLHGLFKK